MKICLLGDVGVGKRALLERLVFGRLDTIIRYKTRLSIDPTTYFTKEFIMNEDEIRLVSWYPMVGDLTFKFSAKIYFKGARGLILAYDITNDDSLYNLEGWIKDYRENAERLDLPMVLVGCKVDLEENRSVSKDEALEFTKKHKTTQHSV